MTSKLPRAKSLPHQSTRYTLDVDLDLEQGTYRGHQKIIYTNRGHKPLSDLVVWLYPNRSRAGPKPSHSYLTVHSVRVDGARAALVNTAGQILTIGLPNALAPGKTVSVTFDIAGKVTQRPPRDDATATRDAIQGRLKALRRGTSGSPHTAFVFTPSEQMTLGLWYPLVSSRSSNTWDLKKGSNSAGIRIIEPADYEVRVAAATGVTVMSTGFQVAQRATKAKQFFRFQANAARGVGLIAMREATHATRKVGPVIVRSTFRSRDEVIGKRVLNHAVSALRFFEASFGPYPFAELDIVQADLLQGASGMSFPGLVALSSAFYGPKARVGAHRQLLGGLMSRELLEETLEFVVAHEVAHAWWGAVVAHDRHRAAVFDEALAQHSALLFIHDQRGEASAQRHRVLQMQLGYRLSRLMGLPDLPLLVSQGAFDNTFHRAAISYGKGGLFLHDMLGRARSRRAHLGALAKYFAEHRFGIGNPNRLLDSLVASAERPHDLRQAALRWLKARHGDDDVGPLDAEALLSLIPQALRSDPTVRAVMGLLRIKNFGRASDLLKAFVEGDLATSLDAIHALVPDDSGPLKSVLKRLQQVVADPEVISDTKRLPGFLTAIARDLAGDDPKWGAWIDAASEWVDSQNSAPRHTTTQNP